MNTPSNRPSASVPLPDAACRGGVERLKERLQAPHNLEEKDKDGRTALFRTARLGRTEHVNLLLQHGASPNTTDYNDEAPLQVAARYGHLEIVEALIAAGADLNHLPDAEVTHHSETALYSAAKEGHLRIVEALLQAGASHSAVSSAKFFPLHGAAKLSEPQICQALLQAGADLEAKDRYGRTALHYAVNFEQPAVVRCLLSAGADVNAKTNDCLTPLLKAVSARPQSAALVAALLPFKPDLAALTPHGRQTALELALEVKNNEVANLLRAAGSPAPSVKPEEEEEIEIVVELTEDDLKQCSELESEAESSETNSPASNQNDEELAGAEDDDSGETSVASPTSAFNGSDPEDLRIAKELTDLFVPTSFSEHLPSGAHHALILHCGEPLPIQRMAYFARGYLNAPLGRELEDGVKVLGEPYEAAAERLVASGLLRKLSPRELVERLATVADCHAVAESHNLKVHGKRQELLQRLLEQPGPEAFTAVLSQGPLYTLTSVGYQALGAEPPPSAEAATEAKTKALEALRQRDYVRAALLLRPLSSVRSQTAPVFSIVIAKVRCLMVLPIPTAIHHSADQEELLRSIAAAHLFNLIPGDKWSAFASVEAPTHLGGKALSPRAFAQCVLAGRYVKYSS